MAKGYGVDKNPRKEYVRLSLAVRCGHFKVYKYRDATADSLSEEELKRARQEVKELFEEIKPNSAAFRD